MQIENLVREFKYNSVVLPDPNPAFDIAQVRDFFASVYPDILNAEIEGPDVKGNKQIYTFRRAVGTKGGCTPSDMIGDLVALLQAGWMDQSDAEFIKRMHQEDLELQQRAIAHVMPGFPADDSLKLIELHRKYCGKVIEVRAA